MQMVARTGHPDFLDLPWDVPLEAWETPRIIEVPKGVHRHVVRVLRYDDRRYVVKELPRRLAEREYRLLRRLVTEHVPVVDVVGVVRDRRDAEDDPLEAVLITRHLDYSLPYRLLFQRRDAAELRDKMLDALVDLLVRIHLVGFMWGDCSLSNTLFRRDAGRLAAYVVDVETGELHENGLTEGQRSYDIDLAVERCAGEVFDLVAAELVPPQVDPLVLAEDLAERYHSLWAELHTEEVFETAERDVISARLRRINELGYDVDEIVLTGDEDLWRLETRMVEPGRYRRQLRELTGLTVQDNQARRLLADIDSFGRYLRERDRADYSQDYVARRWMEMSFGPTIGVVPEEQRGKREEAEVFHEVLDHWYFKTTVEGHDLSLFDAARSYVDNVLQYEEQEQVVEDPLAFGGGRASRSPSP